MRLLDFDQAYREGRIGDHLVYGDSGAVSADGPEVLKAVRRGKPRP